MATDEVEQHALTRAVAVEILVHGPQPRASLARRLGVSAATLTRVTRPLVESGVLVEGGAIRTPGRGRSSLPLDVVPDARHFVGVKLTRESIYGVLVDLRAQVLHTEIVAEPSLAVDEVVAAVREYTDLGFDHLVFHGPGGDQERFLRTFAEQVVPGLRELVPAGDA